MIIDQNLGIHIINLLTGIILLLTIVIYMSNSTRRFAISFAIQSIALSGLAIFIAYYTIHPLVYVTALLTFLFKGILFPQIIIYTMKKVQIVEEREPFVNISATLLIVAAIAIFSFIIIEPVLAETSVITKDILPFAFAITLIGLFMMATKKKANSQIFGLLVMENGLAMAVLATTYEMPIIVEFGVIIDVFISIIILTVFLFGMNKKFNSINITNMMELSE